MEIIKKFLKLLGVIKDRRLKEIQAGRYNCATCTPLELQAWQDFIAYIDLLESDKNYPARKTIAEVVSQNSTEITGRLEIFKRLLQSRDDWSEILRFAELPIQFDYDTFEQLTTDYATAKTVHEQTAIIPRLFNATDPTHLEMLFLLIEGVIERQPQPQTQQFCELIEREKSARVCLKQLIEAPLNDPLRWWLIRTINSATGSAQAFLKETVKKRHDIRLQCMLLPMLLKIGFEWAEKFGDNNREATESMQSHQFASRISRLIELIEPA